MHWWGLSRSVTYKHLISNEEITAFTLFNLHRRKIDLPPIDEEEFSTYQVEREEGETFTWLLNNKIYVVNPWGYEVHTLGEKSFLVEGHYPSLRQ